jgi:hypothetical protein
MLGGILLLYAVIVTFGGASAGGLARTAMLGLVAVEAARRLSRRDASWWIAGLAVALFATVTWASAYAGARVSFAIVGAASFLLVLATMVSIAAALHQSWTLNTATVLGVLCIYLLFALLFASLHQLLAAFTSDYVAGVEGRPTPSDLLYFSVITMATVGFGDITPASEAARAVVVTEALVGQLYIVSVVAFVVGGWRPRPRDERD